MDDAAALDGLSLAELKSRAEKLGITEPAGHKGHKKTWIQAINSHKAETVDDAPSPAKVGLPPPPSPSSPATPPAQEEKFKSRVTADTSPQGQPSFDSIPSQYFALHKKEARNWQDGKGTVAKIQESAAGLMAAIGEARGVEQNLVSGFLDELFADAKSDNPDVFMEKLWCSGVQFRDAPIGHKWIRLRETDARKIREIRETYEQDQTNAERKEKYIKEWKSCILENDALTKALQKQDAGECSKQAFTADELSAFKVKITPDSFVEVGKKIIYKLQQGTEFCSLMSQAIREDGKGGACGAKMLEHTVTLMCALELTLKATRTDGVEHKDWPMKKKPMHAPGGSSEKNMTFRGIGMPRKAFEFFEARAEDKQWYRVGPPLATSFSKATANTFCGYVKDKGIKDPDDPEKLMQRVKFHVHLVENADGPRPTSVNYLEHSMFAEKEFLFSAYSAFKVLEKTEAKGTKPYFDWEIELLACPPDEEKKVPLDAPLASWH